MSKITSQKMNAINLKDADLKIGDFVVIPEGKFEIVEIMPLADLITMEETIGIFVNFNGFKRKVVNNNIIDIIKKNV